MRPDSRFKRFWTRIKSGIVQDVPPHLEACESSCKKEDCSEEHFASCAQRLTVKAERTAAAENEAKPQK